MENEKRLIDANALIEHLTRCIEKSKGLMCSVCVAIKCFVEQMPTVDAVVWPCKPLDTVYFIECRTDGNHKIRSGFALSVEYNVCYKPLITIRYNDNTLESTKHYLGMKAFMTREEAEAALAKMDGDGNG